MAWERTAVGLDVHARSVVAGVLDTDTGQLWSQRLPAATPAVVSWVGSLPGPGMARICWITLSCARARWYDLPGIPQA